MLKNPVPGQKYNTNEYKKKKNLIFSNFWRKSTKIRKNKAAMKQEPYTETTPEESWFFAREKNTSLIQGRRIRGCP
jgi:hypothetical protein